MYRPEQVLWDQISRRINADDRGCRPHIHRWLRDDHVEPVRPASTGQPVQALREMSRFEDHPIAPSRVEGVAGSETDGVVRDGVRTQHGWSAPHVLGDARHRHPEHRAPLVPASARPRGPLRGAAVATRAGRRCSTLPPSPGERNSIRSVGLASRPASWLTGLAGVPHPATSASATATATLLSVAQSVREARPTRSAGIWTRRLLSGRSGQGRGFEVQRALLRSGQDDHVPFVQQVELLDARHLLNLLMGDTGRASIGHRVGDRRCVAEAHRSGSS